MMPLVYERTLHDHRTKFCYEIEGYADDAGGLQYIVFYGNEWQPFQDEDTMKDFLRTDIAHRRGQLMQERYGG